jgi:sigma-B regulation protein RsbU (phosphoserine phosphatase)
MATVAFKRCDQPESLPRAIAPVGNPQKCVLLIEDDEEAMFLVRFALQEHGKGAYRLEWVAGLSGGLERLQKPGVDLVLLDLGLPESSGPASYTWVREVAPEVPVLVLTGDAREETEFAIAASGVEDYLVKDQVSGALLMQAIRSALHTTKRGDSRIHRLQPAGDEPAPRKMRMFVPIECETNN